MFNVLKNTRITFYVIVTLILITLVSLTIRWYLNSSAGLSKGTPTKNHFSQIETSFKRSDLQRKEDITNTPLNKHSSEQPIEVKQCEEHCLALIYKLAEGDTLLADDLTFIIKNAITFANTLKNEPSIMAILLNALQDDENANINQHDAAYAVVEALSVQDKTEVAYLISSSNNADDRISALKLLQEGIKFDAQAVETFVSILTSEYDPAVQIMAINMTRQITGEHNQEQARDALDNIIQSNDSDYSSGEALLAKISISPSSSLVAQDVHSLMSSFSSELQLYGLQAFEKSMEYYNAEFDTGDGWAEYERIEQSIIAIAQNEHADTNHRNKAQNILEQFF